MRNIIEKAKALLKGRANGSMIDVMISMLMVLVIAIIASFFIGFFQLLSINESFKEVARAEMLVAESKGFLSTGDIAVMTAALQDIGAEDVSITLKDKTGKNLNSEASTAGYGELMYLTVTCKVNNTYLVPAARDILSIRFGTKAYTLTLEQISTSKQ